MINKNLLFPENSRQFFGKRWLKILLRTAHLLGLSGVGAIFLFDQSFSGAQFFLYLVVGSGISMVALDIWSNGIWILQLRGQAIILKLLLFYIMVSQPEYTSLCFIVIVILSGVISHAPGNLRYYSIYHGKRLHSIEEKG